MGIMALTGLLLVFCLPGLLVLPTTGFPAEDASVNNSAGFQAAAQYLLRGLDFTVDPCQDFYQFTCNTYLKNAVIPAGASRIGTYDESQELVNSQIAAQVPAISSSSSLTEQIFNRGYQSCLVNFNSPSGDLSNQINKQLLSQIGGLPMLTPGWKAPSWDALWLTIGQWESQYYVPSIFSSYVSVDYGDNTRHALYINQGGLQLPRDYYVKMEYLASIDDYQSQVIDLVQTYNHLIGAPASNSDIATAVTNSIKFEILLALAMVPDELLRNYEQQYNLYNLTYLSTSYRSIRWEPYLAGLLQDVDPNFRQDKYVVVQPSYFSAVDSMIGGQRIDQQVIADFVGIRLLLVFSDFIGPEFRQIKKNIASYSASTKSHKFIRRPAGRKPLQFYDEGSQFCVNFMTDMMPYGAGYIYVAQNKDRDAIKADVTRQTELIIESFLNMTHSLTWIDQYSLQNVITKNKDLVRNVAWPYWFNFLDTSYMDTTYHKYYHNIMNVDIKDFFTMTLDLSHAVQETENFALLEQPPDRRNFGGSPATVNAWYIPERNSITFPLAALNPPYYRLDFPQAFNYAGQGGTAGHELTHGYDDEGVQFGPTGELSDCTWERCGWMDKNSTLGFINMAQCVVSQFSEKCCPLKTGNVHCANGANTQGENIADLGGQQSAYKAYRTYIDVDRNGVEEGRLPGLEQFNANQIFWITYGFSWCMKQTDASMVNQLLTNPHSPAQCRVNQVMQDIPEFGKDFKCGVNTPMYPLDSERCKVWTDAPLV